MTSQETIDFVEDIFKTILSRWDTIPLDMKDKMRDELMSVFNSFVGAFVGENNKALKINKLKEYIYADLFLFLAYRSLIDLKA